MLLISISTKGQNVNPTTHQVTNWNTRLSFNYTYTYDLDLKQNTSEAFRANCIVVLEVGQDGTGRLITAINGDKKVAPLFACVRANDIFIIDFHDSNNKAKFAYVSVANNIVQKFWMVNDQNIALVFSN